MNNRPAGTASADARPKLWSVAGLVRGSTSRVAQLCVSTVIGFLLTPFIVHSLGARQYGIWALAFAFIGYYSLLDLGMSAAVFTHVSYSLGRQEHEETQRVYSTGLAIFGSCGLILALASVVLALGAAHFYHSWLIGGVILVVGLSTATSFPLRVHFGTLNAGSHFEITSGLLMLSLVLRALLTVIVLRMHHGVLALAIVSAAATMPTNVLVIAATKWRYPFLHVLRAKYRRETGGNLIRFGFPVLFGQLADRVRLQTDSITVSFFVGLVALAHYNIATTLVMYYIDGVAAITGVIGPVLAMQQSVRDEQGVRRSLLMGTRVGLVVSGFVLFGLIAWGHAFIQRWMGTQYVDAYPVLVILACAVFFDASQSTTINAFYVTLNQKYYAALNGAEAIANLVLSIVLARPFGMIGIALGTLIPAVVVRTFVQPVLIEKRLGLSVRDYWAVSLPTLLRTVACLIVPLAITRFWLRPTYPSLFLVGGLSTVAFAIAVWGLEFRWFGADRLTGGLFLQRPSVSEAD